ncbi:HCLS1-associated protein X-1 [Xyrichtys novacula]|uniref:HCLS1-associated protein X-1 n=1 Tax=Xyrichtys novacula TaxID=13765 RepID=A0AAV1HG23_XYRNO|nr:HCLS1-associated protein X-1 [Xyrichtys novacula]
MSVFDLFRGFFGVPGGHYRGRRDPFFDAMTHDDDDEDDEEDEDVFYYDEFRGDQQDPFDGDWRFGFSFGPNGVRIQEPPVFGQVLREMEEIFSQLGREDGQHFGVPKLPPPEDGGKSSEDRSSGNPLRDFMLKSPDTNTHGLREPRKDSQPSYESPGVYGWTPFPKFSDIWKRGPQTAPEDERKEDRDLDSAVSSRGLDQVLTPPAGQAPDQPRTFFQSVTVTKVVKPDGTVEERRTVRDGQGNEETTVTRSGGPCSRDDHTGPLMPGDQHPFSDMRDDGSLFSKFFRGFK